MDPRFFKQVWRSRTHRTLALVLTLSVPTLSVKALSLPAAPLNVATVRSVGRTGAAIPPTGAVLAGTVTWTLHGRVTQTTTGAGQTHVHTYRVDASTTYIFVAGATVAMRASISLLNDDRWTCSSPCQNSEVRETLTGSYNGPARDGSGNPAVDDSPGEEYPDGSLQIRPSFPEGDYPASGTYMDTSRPSGNGTFQLRAEYPERYSWYPGGYPTYQALATRAGNPTLQGSATQNMADMIIVGVAVALEGQETVTWHLVVVYWNGVRLKSPQPQASPTLPAAPRVTETAIRAPAPTTTPTATPAPPCATPTGSGGTPRDRPSNAVGESQAGASQCPSRRKPLLLVGLGDSVASGEGDPDGVTQVRSDIHIRVNGVLVPLLVPRGEWENETCHRSRYGFEAWTARVLDRANPGSIDYVPLSCSGASIDEGLLGPYNGIEPQVTAMQRELARRERTQADIVLLSVGANDLEFGKIVVSCALPRIPLGPFERCFKRFEPEVQARLSGLRQKFKDLAARLNPLVADSRHVFITEYFDPSRDARGRLCNNMFPMAMDQQDIQWMYDTLVVKLNAAIKAAVTGPGGTGWTYIGDIRQGFRTHGYCSFEQRWVRTVPDSLAVQGDPVGTLHPNEAGQCYIAEQVLLYLGNTTFPQGRLSSRALPCSGGQILRCDALSPDNVRFRAPDGVWMTAGSLRGKVYYPVDRLGRPTGVLAQLTEQTIQGGTEPSRDPPGYEKNRGYARGHLLARQLGGAGTGEDGQRNLVALFQNPTNVPLMSSVEDLIVRRVDAGTDVYFRAIPLYAGNGLEPTSVEIEAVGSDGFYIHVRIPNTDNRNASLLPLPPSAICPVR